jgi:hypothetical protein
VFFTKNDDFVLASYLIRSRFIQELGEGKTLLEISRGAVLGWRDEASAPRAGARFGGASTSRSERFSR